MTTEPTTPEIVPAAPMADAVTAIMNASETMAGLVDALRGVLEPMAEFIATIDRLYGPAVRIMNRYIKLRQHRRHQDERRCYAKQARREHTGWRQW